MVVSNYIKTNSKPDSYSDYEQNLINSDAVHNQQEFNPATGAHTIGDYSSSLDEINKVFKAIEVFQDISQKSEGEIKLLEKYGFFPVLIGKDQEPFPLYSFIEVLDGLIEYNEILDEIPSITLTQVQNTMTFLRKLTSINIFNADLDELEDSIDSDNSDYFQKLINSKNVIGDKRVLYHDK